MLDKRDELIGKLARTLGLIGEPDLARAVELKKRFPDRGLDQILQEMGLLTKEARSKLVHAFNDKVRAARGGRPGESQHGRRGAALTDSSAARRDAERHDRRAPPTDPEVPLLLTPPPSEDTIGATSDPEVPGDEQTGAEQILAEPTVALRAGAAKGDEAAILAEPTLMLPDEELRAKEKNPRSPEPASRPRPTAKQPRVPSDAPTGNQVAAGAAGKADAAGNEDAILAEPTLMLPDEELRARKAPAAGRAKPPGHKAGLEDARTRDAGTRDADARDAGNEDAILAEPTLMLRDEELRAGKPPAARRPKPPVAKDAGNEDAILAEPTLMLPDEELRAAKAPAGTRARPGGEDAARTEDEILAEPTLSLPDDLDDDRPGPNAAPGNDDAAGNEDAILAEPTLMLRDAELRKRPGPRPAPSEEEILSEPTLKLRGEKAGEPLDLAPEPSQADDLPDSIMAGPNPGATDHRPGVKKKAGVLDRKEFEKRSRLRLGFEGMRLGDYEIAGELSRGAFGVVLKVRPEGQGRALARERGFDGEFMAMKVMLETNDPEETRRFMDEIRVLIDLVHPNIIRIFDAGVENGLKFYTMELINGVDTRTLVREHGGKLPVLYGVRIAKDVASALAIVHARTVYHRDLKPANIMIDRASQPYRTVLIDFGLAAKRAGAKGDEGLILGTPSYMPPEQAKPKGGFGEVNATSDVYSLGATFYFLVTGQPPFGGKDPRAIIKRVCTELPADPATLTPDIPRSIAGLCMKCLAKNQRDRYTAARLLEAELERELSAAQLKLKAKSVMRRLFGGGGSAPPPAKA